MTRIKQKDFLVLLARDLADHVATPIFLVDPDGVLIFFNEGAEAILGQSFEEAGELTADEWGSRWLPHDLGGNPIPAEDLPLYIAFSQKRPAHGPMLITGIDGAKRQLEVTAFPLLSRSNETVGAVAIFWEERRRKSR